jgi:hypothetical protein
MKTNHKTILLLALAITIIACNALIPKPTEMPVPKATSLPTSAFTPEPRNTPQSTEKPIQIDATPTETLSDQVFPTPAGTPAKNWEGIPIMPGAIAGEGDSRSYSFTTQTPTDEIQKFYEKEMAKLGWNMFATSEGNTQTVLLMFMKGSDNVTISIISQSDGVVYVMFVK